VLTSDWAAIGGGATTPHLTTRSVALTPDKVEVVPGESMQDLGLGRLECGSQLDLDVVDVRRGWEKQEETSERMKGSFGARRARNTNKERKETTPANAQKAC